MSKEDHQSSKPLIRAFLGGTAIAFAMVGLTLFWVSSQKNVFINNEQKPSFAIVQPDVSSLIKETQNAASSESVFSSSPKKVKSLSIETKPD